MKHSISPYPPHVRSLKNGNVFAGTKFVGCVDRVSNWGTDFLARPEGGKPNKFHKTKTEAVLYLIG